MAIRTRSSYVVLYTILTMVAIVHLFPLIVTFANSLRTDASIKQFPIGIPSDFAFSNYVDAWLKGGYGQAFINSVVVSTSTTLIVLAASIIAGYFLARSTIRTKGLILTYLGIALSIPVFSFLIPVYFAFSNLELVNTLAGLVLIFIAVNLPFNVLLARTFIQGIPKELDESATMDGCTTYQVLWRIVFPIAKPIVTTIALIVFVTTWNEFTVANTFLQSPELKTASTRYVLFVSERGSNLALVYTAGVVTMLPIVAVFIFLQNYFIDGMTSGSLK
jgi:raffinose/stachyose/melibiose transport system permease protein